MLIEDLTNDERREARLLALVIAHWTNIVNVTNPSHAIQMAAVKQNPNALSYIKDPDEEAQLIAIQQDASLIHKIKNPGRAVMKAAINKQGLAIQYIKNIPRDVIEDCKRSILKAILESFKNDNQRNFYTATIMMNLLKNTYHVNWPELDVIQKSLDHEKAINESSELNNASEAKQIEVVGRTGFMIQYIINPSEAVQLAAIRQNGFSIRYIRNPSENVKLAAVIDSPDDIQWIDDPSEKIQLTAINKYGYTIKYIENPTESAQLLSVKNNPDNIKYIKRPTDKVKNLAVSKNGATILYMKAKLNRKLLDNNKYSIIKSILQFMKEAMGFPERNEYHIKYRNSMNDMIRILTRFNINWSELATIKRSLAHDIKK